jgi:uncharacterized protein involved in tolerance to divalent cations
MINMYFYLDKTHSAEHLVEDLLENGLVAHASIDLNNNSMLKVNGKIKKQICSLITAQTKALLFDKISKYLTDKYHNHIKIYSAPIAQCNETFSDLIRSIDVKKTQ